MVGVNFLNGFKSKMRERLYVGEKQQQCPFKVKSLIFILQGVAFLILKTEEDNSGCYFTDIVMMMIMMKNGYVCSHVTDLKTIRDLFPKAAQKD